MIDTFYPFDIKKVNSINEYLIIIKNCFRLIQRHGISVKVKGVLFYVSWSETLNKLQVNFVHKINKHAKLKVSEKFNQMILENTSLNKFIENILFKKSNNRCLAFVYETAHNDVYFLGLYRFYEVNTSVKKLSLIENSDSLINSITSLDYRILNTKLQFKLKDYNKLYNTFLNSIVIEDRFLSRKTTTSKKRLTFKRYSEMMLSDTKFKYEDLFISSIYYITLQLGKFINNLLFNKNENKDFIVHDLSRNQFIKIPSRFYDESKLEIIDTNLLPPLMPARY